VFTIRFPGFDGRGMAVGADGVLHVAGGDVYARFPADGSRMLASATIPGSVYGMAIDADSNVYLTGVTTLEAFADALRVSAVRPRGGLGGVGAAFFLKLDAKSLTRVTSGYLAGSRYDCGAGSSCFTRQHDSIGLAVAVDRERNIVFAGNSEVRDLPTSEGALLRTGIGGFVAKVSADGSRLLYSTYLSSRNDPTVPFAFPATEVSDLALDSEGNPIVCGRTRDENFPSTAGCDSASVCRSYRPALFSRTL
jgi:hypothetical protein